MTVKIVFETTVCDRCGGTGRMPFAAYGGICFKCSPQGTHAGSGTVHTRKGSSALKKWNAFVQEQLGTTIDQVEVGDTFRVQGHKRLQTLASEPEVVNAETGQMKVTFTSGDGYQYFADSPLKVRYMITTAFIRDNYPAVLGRMSGATLIDIEDREVA